MKICLCTRLINYFQSIFKTQSKKSKDDNTPSTVEKRDDEWMDYTEFIGDGNGDGPLWF